MDSIAHEGSFVRQVRGTRSRVVPPSDQMPFDSGRMVFGGFTPIFEMRR